MSSREDRKRMIEVTTQLTHTQFDSVSRLAGERGMNTLAILAHLIQNGLAIEAEVQSKSLRELSAPLARRFADWSDERVSKLVNRVTKRPARKSARGRK